MQNSSWLTTISKNKEKYRGGFYIIHATQINQVIHIINDTLKSHRRIYYLPCNLHTLIEDFLQTILKFLRTSQMLQTQGNTILETLDELCYEVK